MIEGYAWVRYCLLFPGLIAFSAAMSWVIWKWIMKFAEAPEDEE